jgi:uncharacterized protein (DUF1501 family)
MSTNDPRTTRRRVLGWTLAAGAAALVHPRLPFAVAKDRAKGKPDADAPLPGRGAAQRVVLLYMAGGATQFETWNPKKKGSANMGEAEPIATSVEGIEIGSHFARTAKVMDDVALVRSVTTREGNHDRGRYLMHTGYVPNPTVSHPGIGSYLAAEIGSRDAVLPNFVSIGGSQGAGFLGVEWDPFVDNASAPVANLAPPTGIDRRRRDTRLQLLERLNGEFEGDRGDEAVAPHRTMFERAKRLMDTPRNRAFDVSEEPESVHKLYGETTFGKGCIAARRLLESGVKVVEVIQGGWDTHNNEHAAVKALAEALDPAFSGLLTDLRDRGMLESTLVYWFTEFGRTPRLGEGGNGEGGRGHYPQAFSVAMAGGGVRGGRVLGATDADGVAVADRPVDVRELHATICHATGVDQDKVRFAGRRPIRIVDQPEGKRHGPLLELFT